MIFTSIIKKTVTGIMQSVGGFAEPITNTLGLRVRTAASNSLELTHNDTDAQIEASAGKLKVVASSLELNGGNIPACTTGNTASRPGSPTLGQEYFDSDLDAWIKWNGAQWRHFTGVEA